MRLSHLLLAPLAAPLFFASPATAQVGPPCCQRAGESHGPDRHPEETLPPSLVPAEVARPNERALEAAAEAPLERKAPLVNAIGIPLEPVGEERRGVSEPERVGIAEPASSQLANGQPVPDRHLDFPGCCHLVGVEDPHDHPEENTPPILVGAKVENREKDRLLAMVAELPIPIELPLVKAIGIPLDAQRGVSEPEHRRIVEPPSSRVDSDTPAAPADLISTPPCCQAERRVDRPPIEAPWQWLRSLEAKAEVVVPVLIALMVVGFWLWWRRRRPRPELEPLPMIRPMPDELPLPDVAPVPAFEPTFARAVRAGERELEDA